MTNQWKNFRVDKDLADRTTIWIDVAERSMNVLSESVFDELESILDQLAASRANSPVLFRSAKPKGFIVGADLKRIAQIKSDEQIQAFLQRGQSTFSKMEASPLTTIALIHGPCLGGGLEWALACDFRIASLSEQTQIGMPESKLGLIPGWGGTVRLRETVGSTKALEMLLTGESIGALEAHSIGLVDTLCNDNHHEDRVTEFIASPNSARHPAQEPDDSTGRLHTILERWADSQNPAHATLMRVFESSLKFSRQDGFDAEQTSFFSLLNSQAVQENLARFAKPSVPRVS